MNQRLLTVFAFAVVVAGLASFLVYRFVATHVQMTPKAPTTRLLVAAHDLDIGSMVKNADVQEVDWAGAIPPQAVTKPQEAVGRGVVTKIYKNEPLVAERLAAQGAGAGMAATIPLGMRAVAIRVNDVIGLAGFVLPGMHVDVIVSGNAPQAAQAGTVSRTVLQNIEVLSAGQKTDRTAEGKPEDAQVVNLLVTPEQAEVLSLANNEAKVQLVLRNPMDTKSETTRGASVSGLFGGGAPPASAGPRAGSGLVVRRERPAPSIASKTSTSAVEIFSGAKRSETTFAAPGAN